MRNDQFETFVSEAIDAIPDKYQQRMQHVAIVVEDEPTPEQRQKLGLRHCDALFGLYEGVPLTRRNGSTLSIVPDKITIFKYPMIEMFPDENALRDQIKETVWHEVAHFFGLDHDMIHKAKRKQPPKR